MLTFGRALISVAFASVICACGTTEPSKGQASPVAMVTPAAKGSPPAPSNPSGEKSDLTATGCPIPPLPDGDWGDSGEKSSRPNLRVSDLIAAQGIKEPVRGNLYYGKSTHEALEGFEYDRRPVKQEGVCVYAKERSGWRALVKETTDAKGGFTVPASEFEQFPVGAATLHLSVLGGAGDKGGGNFVALVVDRDTKLVVSDVDGTLTERELPLGVRIPLGARIPGLPVGVTISNVKANANAPQALNNLSQRSQIVYLTARPDGATNATRGWLEKHGFPPGLLRLVPSCKGLSGDDAVKFKKETMMEIIAAMQRVTHNFQISAGIGNRSSDQQAYCQVGLPPDRIFIFRSPKWHEKRLLSHEVACIESHNLASVFDSYGSELNVFKTLPAADLAAPQAQSLRAMTTCGNCSPEFRFPAAPPCPDETGLSKGLQMED